MAELNDNALRTVTLESVAAYLRCDSQRLATALRRLAETPSVVKYGIGESACITPAVTLYSMTPEAEVHILGAGKLCALAAPSREGPNPKNLCDPFVRTGGGLTVDPCLPSLFVLTAAIELDCRTVPLDPFYEHSARCRG